MNKLTNLLILAALMAVSCANSGQKEETMETKQHSQLEAYTDAGLKYDSFTTPKGREVNLIFIKHGSIILDIDGYEVYIDPVTMFGTDFTKLPKADMLLVTHEHHDHFDPQAIEDLSVDSTCLIMSERVTELYGKGTPMVPGQTIEVEPQNFTITATPAYNITEGHLDFHPKARKDIGFVFDIDGLRIYVAGDTEDIPEMADLKDIDIAFIPVNQPYTMTPEQAIHAAEMIHPRILYPYHYGETDLTPLVEHFEGSSIDVRVRQLQ